MSCFFTMGLLICKQKFWGPEIERDLTPVPPFLLHKNFTDAYLRFEQFEFNTKSRFRHLAPVPKILKKDNFIAVPAIIVSMFYVPRD